MCAEAHQPKLGLSLNFLVDFYLDYENISRWFPLGNGNNSLKAFTNCILISAIIF